MPFKAVSGSAFFPGQSSLEKNDRCAIPPDEPREPRKPRESNISKQIPPPLKLQGHGVMWYAMNVLKDDLVAGSAKLAALGGKSGC